MTKLLKSQTEVASRRSLSRPQWAERVERLRRGMKHGHTTLGKKLGFSAMAVSR